MHEPETAPHEPVLLAETIAQLAVSADGFYVDATYGRGGHSRAILERLGADGRLLVLDRDPEACAHARAQLGADARVDIREDCFVNLPRLLRAARPARRPDGLLLDLGVSSAQLDSPARGFSFRHDGPLDMRMGASGRTAAQWLAAASVDAIARVLRAYGEERHARRIARAIAQARMRTPLATTGQLARVIEDAAPRGPRRLHPATRSFQAIRIFINRELEQLEQLLQATPDLLAADGRLAVLSFHSLEDRLVKRFLAAQSRPPAVSRFQPAPAFRPRFAQAALIRPGEAEVARNPRARSARLRAARRLP